jgi:hypothetical protein
VTIQHYRPGTTTTVYTKVQDGDGTNGDPYVPEMAARLLQGGTEVDGANPLEVEAASVVVAVEDVQDRIGGTADAEASGNGTLIAIVKYLRTLTGALGETAPASDTASSGLNGRLQRIAQRLTSLIALVPASLGQKARASAFAVTLSTEDMTALTPARAGTESSPLVTTGKTRDYTPSLSVSVATYAAGTAISGVFELTSIVPAAGRGTFLHSVQVNCVQAPSFLRIIFLKANPASSTVNNNVALSIAYADQGKVAGHINIGAGDALDANTYSAGISSTSPTLPKKIPLASGSTSLFVVFQAISSVTFAGTADLDVTLSFMDD